MTRPDSALHRSDGITRMTTSPAEHLLSVQLEQAGIPFEREYRFHPLRKWRFDFAIINASDRQIAVEVEGGVYVAGRHTRGATFEADCVKYAQAAIRGWTVLRVTPNIVNDGRALQWIKEALGLERAA